MIESGFYQWAVANSKITKFMGNVDPRRVQPFKNFYYSFLPKQPVLPAIVFDRLKSNDEAETLDPTTDGPSQIAAIFQFGSVAENNPENPVSPDGYFSAAYLSAALRAELKALATGDFVLPDGTVIEDLVIEDEFDAHYELGGGGYILRRVIRIAVIYQEAGAYVPYVPQFYEGDGAPTTSENNEDLYYDESTGNLYEQVAGAWVLVGNVPAGTGGGSITRYDNQDTGGLTATVNPAVWTLAVPFTANAMVFWNGEMLSPGVDYTTIADLITYSIAPSSEDDLAVVLVVSGSGGGGGETMPSLVYHLVATSGVNAATIKASPGIVTGWKIYNDTEYPIYVKLFDLSSLPFVGSNAPKQTLGVDAGESDGQNSAGFSYVTGIGIAITKGLADLDETPVVAGDCVVDIFYQ